MAFEDELPWTISRCNRLLRPLTTKLNRLKGELERSQSPTTESAPYSSAFATKGSPHKTTNFTRPARKPRGFEKASDPDWRPDTKKGASKKTYGGRSIKQRAPQNGSTNNGPVPRAGEIGFTPLVARMSTQLQSSPQGPMSPLRNRGGYRGPSVVELSRLKAQGELERPTRGILDAYANILEATKVGSAKTWKGTRSLMGTCLRKLPAYIELEEHFAKLDREANDEEEERDAAAETYEELEAQFEQGPGFGWKPFKYIVRAHATDLVCKAMADGILELESVLLFTTHCVNAGAWPEAEELLTSYLPSLNSINMPINLKADLFDAQRCPYLAALKTFVDHTGRHRLLYHILEQLIAYELLPLEWLATQCMRPIWDRLARTVSNNDPRTFAYSVQFLETVLLAGMGLPDERLLNDEATGGIRRFVPSSRTDLRLALNTTYSSLLTVLCSIALVNLGRDEEVGKKIAKSIAWTLDRTYIAIAQRKDIFGEMRILAPSSDDICTFAQRGTWAVFATVLLRLDNCYQNDTTAIVSIQDRIKSINALTEEYSLPGVEIASLLGSLPELVSSTARGTGRIWKDDGFEQLKRLVQALISLSGCRLPHKLWTTKRLALESATEFAQSGGDAEYLTFSRDIEKLLHKQGRLVIISSPVKNATPSSGGGFRWEEGIGEWIACTPFARQNVKRQPTKPLQALQLLPTPVQSEDEENAAPDAEVDSSGMWETTDFMDNDAEDDVLPSSPIKQFKRPPPVAVKRKRASSPMVIVVAKRMHLTPPESPITFYPSLPEEQKEGLEEDGRRSRRSRREIKTLTARLRTQRSRNSTEGGLRGLVRRSYMEQSPEDDGWRDSSSAEDDGGAGDRASSDSESGSETSPRSKRAAKRAETSTIPQSDSPADDVDEGDDLGITPAQIRKQRPILRKAVVRKQPSKEWWKVEPSVVHDSDDGSEDELSFH